MERLRNLFPLLGLVVSVSVAAVGQQGAAAGSAPGSAIKAVRPAIATNTPESASMTVACQSAVELMIADSRGRRLGYDPVTHASYDEIPSAYYEAGGIDDDETGEPEEDPAKTIFIPNPAGSYKLTIVGTKAAAYSCQFMGQDARDTPAELKDMAIAANEVQVFLVRMPTGAQSKIEIVKKK